MKVYLLTCGEYSDYRVLGVFDEEHLQKAKEIAEKIGASVDDGEFAIELNGFAPEEPPRGSTNFWIVRLDINGNVKQCDAYSLWEENGSLKHSHYYYEEYGDSARTRFTVMAYSDSAEHIIKVANELRAQVIAKALPESGDILPIIDYNF